MDTVVAKVAGSDGHPKFITVGGRRRLDTGTLVAEVRTFGTMTADLRASADYLEAPGVTPVAPESTGVLSKPVRNILDGRASLLLVDPRPIKRGPRGGCAARSPS
jgi:transposase